MIAISLIVSLSIILLGAELFTNSVEWLGHKWRLAEGAVGSLLAAVGTALPETMIPIISILAEKDPAAAEIGIGAILGAPFMLTTLALALTGLAAVIIKHCRHTPIIMVINPQVIQRDLLFFLILYSLSISAALTDQPCCRPIIVATLVAGYLLYVWLTLKSRSSSAGAHLRPLYLNWGSKEPRQSLVLVQSTLALGCLVAGAHLFVQQIEKLAVLVNLSPLILSLIIAPVATELPEKLNSLIWVYQGKDTLALGNITGAMVFQSSLITALGIALTPWQLTTPALMSAILTLTSASLILYQIRVTGQLKPSVLLFSGLFYLVFIYTVISAS